MRLLILSLLLLAAFPVAARADMEVAMQDDMAVVYGYNSREVALQQFVEMGGTNVRINFEHKRGRSKKVLKDTSVESSRPDLHFYESAVQAVLAHGLEPQMTLVWHQQTSPQHFAVWAANVAQHFGEDVQRYSITNEPDLLLEPHGKCDPKGQRRFVRQFPRLMVKRGRTFRAKVLTKKRTMNLQVACLRYWRGRMYTPIVNEAARAIHGVAPDAEVLAGETSAQPGIDWFMRGVRPRRLRGIIGWAHHPFQLHDLTPHKEPPGTWGMGNLRKLKRVIPLPLYFTEYAYPTPNSRFDKRAFGRRLTWGQVSKALVASWKIARRSGARQMLQYQWFRKPKWRKDPWETAILDDDDGSTTPAYRALKDLILGWR